MKLWVYSLFLVTTSALWSQEVALRTKEVPEMDPLVLKPQAKIDLKVIPECSALWASLKHPGIFWTLSDSGNPPHIVPIKADGTFPITPAGLWNHVVLKGAVNHDWEALTGDATRMMVCDVGNNVSRRKELQIYVFPEPELGAAEVTNFKKYTFSWPDQKVFPDPDLAHDCEAAFIWQQKLYLLTKHRRDTLTDFWRIDLPAQGDKAVATKLYRFDAHGMVTDAALSPDGKKLAVLTYRMLWVLTLPTQGEDIFAGPAWVAPLAPPLTSWQLEGCAWLNSQKLLLGSEQGDLYQVPLSDLREAK